MLVRPGRVDLGNLRYILDSLFGSLVCLQEEDGHSVWEHGNWISPLRKNVFGKGLKRETSGSLRFIRPSSG